MSLRPFLYRSTSGAKRTYRPSSWCIQPVSAIDQGVSSVRPRSAFFHKTAPYGKLTSRKDVQRSRGWFLERESNPRPGCLQHPALSIELSKGDCSTTELSRVASRVGIEPTYIAGPEKPVPVSAHAVPILQAPARRMGIRNPYRCHENTLASPARNL